MSFEERCPLGLGSGSGAEEEVGGERHVDEALGRTMVGVAVWALGRLEGVEPKGV